MHEPGILFSIIVPTFNAALTIERCIVSIFKQEFKDYEIIVQDGLSTDSTVELINQVALEYPHVSIRLNSEKDAGIFDAMNRAALIAKGKFLYFLGADDEFASNAILNKVATFIREKKNVTMVYGNVIWRNTQEIYDGPFSLPKLLERNICHQAMFLSTAAFANYGPFNTNYKACADWDLNIKIFKNSSKIFFLDLIVADYNTDGFSSNNRDLPFENEMQAITTRYYSFPFNRLKEKLRYYKKRLRL